MEQDLTQLRDKVIKKGWEDNKHIRKGRYVQAFSEPLSIPSLYRILKADAMNREIINNVIKKCQKKKLTHNGIK